MESPHLENIVRGQVTKLPRPKELRAVDVSYVSNVQALPLFRKSIKLEMLEMSWIFLLRLGYSGFQYWSQFASRNPASWCGRKLEQPLKKNCRSRHQTRQQTVPIMSKHAVHDKSNESNCNERHGRSVNTFQSSFSHLFTMVLRRLQPDSTGRKEQIDDAIHPLG